MKRKIHLVKKIKFKMNKLFFFGTLFIIVLFLVFNFINKKVTPVLMDYAYIKCKEIATVVINDAIKKEIEKNTSSEELFILTKDDKNNITSVDFNPLLVNKMLTNITDSVRKNLKLIEEGNVSKLDLQYEFDSKEIENGIIYKIPSGVVFNNSIFANMGPKVPVRLNFVGDIVSNIKTNVTNYGINNALIQINIYIAINEKIILPFSSKKILVENDIPVIVKLIQGTVPNYYFKGMSGNSQILTVPIE